MCIEIHFHILDFHTYIFMWMVYPQITSPLFQQILTPTPPTCNHFYYIGIYR